MMLIKIIFSERSSHHKERGSMIYEWYLASTLPLNLLSPHVQKKESRF
jgi:hypothetical protein